MYNDVFNALVSLKNSTAFDITNMNSKILKSVNPQSFHNDFISTQTHLLSSWWTSWVIQHIIFTWLIGTTIKKLYQEFTTVLYQILSNGTADTRVPDANLLDSNENCMSMFQRCQQMQHFWSKEYVQLLQQHTKWKEHCDSPIKPGVLVLCKDDEIPPLMCWLRRVTAIHPGQNIIRSLILKTTISTMKQPVVLPSFQTRLMLLKEAEYVKILNNTHGLPWHKKNGLTFK